MNLNRFRWLCALTICATWFGLACAADERPNLVIIMCDDLGYSDVGFNGAEDILTPELDRLARHGVICTSGYVAHPFCGPSRMGLMSGRYPHTFGAPFNLPNSGQGIEEYNAHGIDVDEQLISTTLNKAGYFTGAIGKWHMGIKQPYHPNTRGFDEYYGFLGGGHKYFPEQYQPIYDRQRKSGKEHINEYLKPLEYNGKEVRETEYITDALSREAAKFVRKAAQRDQPFFLYLAYNAPHSPLEATTEDLAKYAHIKDHKRRTYAAMVHAVDRGVGQLVQALKETKRFENTLVVFLSDNGGKLSLGATNRPLREGKGSTHEGGYRVPMFFHWPAALRPGQQFDHPVSALDLYPTFASLGKAEIPADKKLDGKDIWQDLVSGREPQREGPIYALRHRKGFSDVGARRGEWKVCRTYNSNWKLFNIVNDIGEQNDLSGQHPKLLREMVMEVEQWSESHTEPLWFYTLKEQKEWEEQGMPKFEHTFQVD